MVHPGSHTIAVVVSDVVQREAVLGLLKPSGRAVVQFESIEQAMAGMEASPPGLVIATLSAPRLEGWTLCCRLRSSGREDLHAIPVLILSADMTGAEAVQITAELGGNGLLPYPVGRECLLAEVGRLLDDAAGTSVSYHAVPIAAAGAPSILSVTVDIADRKRYEEESEATLGLLGILTAPSDTRGMLQSLTGFLQQWSGCDAVGVRLREGDDFPYYETRGFPQTFVQAESRLCAPEAAHEVLRACQGETVLECICGAVLSGRTDARMPFFTANGSFWTNSTTGLLATAAPADLPPRMRGRCPREGFESLALIPLRFGGRVLGLLQFNNRKGDSFSPGKIAFLERAAGSIATALEQRRMQEELHRSEERYRQLYLDSPLGYHSLNEDGCLIEVNPAWLEGLGYTRDEVIGHWFGDFLDPGEVGAYPAGFRRFKAAGKTDIELKMKRKDGATVLMAVTGKVVYDAAGQFRHTHCILRDVTEFRRAEESVRASEIKYRSLFEGANDGVFLLDAAGFLDCNQKGAHLLGRARAEIIGRSPADFSPERQPDGRLSSEVAAEMIAAALRGEAACHEWLCLRADGTPFHVEIMLSRVDIADSLQVQAIVRDMTQRKRADEKLRQSEERLRLTLDAAGMVAFEINAVDGTHHEAGPVDRLFGRATGFAHPAVADLAGSVHPADRARVLGTIESALRGECEYRVEYRVPLNDGGEKWISANGTLLRDADGKPARLLGVAVDVTGRKCAEAHLIESEAELKAAQRIAQVGSWQWDLQADKASWSDETFRIFGLAPGQLEEHRRGFLEMIHPDEKARVDQAVTAALNGTAKYDIEYRIQRPDGSEKVIHAQAEVLRDEAGRPTVMQGTVHDITERKRAEEELLLSRQRLALHVQQTPLAVIEFDLDGRLRAWNPGAVKMFGFSSEEAIGQHWTLLVPKSAWGALDGVWEGLLRQRGGSRSTNENLTKDGRTISCEWFNTPLIDPAGNTIGVASLVMDITERRRADQALRESEDKYRVTFQNIPAGVVVHEADGSVSLMNAEAGRLSGYCLDRLAGVGLADWASVTFREDGSACAVEDLPVSRCFRTGEPQADTVLGVRRSDGSVFWAVCSATPVLDAVTGKVVRVVLAYRDITQSKQAEDALKRANQQVRLLANNLREAVSAYDMDRRLIFANPAVESLTGYSAAELLRENFICWIHPDDRERMLEQWEDAFLGRSFTDIECRLITRDGREKWVEASGGPLLDEANRQVGVQGAARDVTDRKRVEAALDESNERFAKAFRSAPVLVAIASLADGTYIDVNDYALEVTGFRREEVIGHTSTGMGLITPENRNRLLETLDQQGRISGLELPFTTKHGRTLVGLVYGEKIVLNGHECLLSVTMDITDKKRAEAERAQLEQQFQQAQKLESIGRLAGGVAHDFNNLLTVINGYSGLALKGLQADDPLRDSLEEIGKAGGRAVELTRQLLAFSRKQIAEPRPVNLNEVILESRGMLERMVGEDIEIVTGLDPEPHHVMADPGQLHQVLMNLVVNARDAMPAGGRVTLRSSRIHLDETEAAAFPGAAPGPYVVMEVSDTGVGMSEETQQKMFEPFFTTKAVGTGTGLGLSTVYGIVRQAGGWISVESQTEKGAALRIGLPLLAEPGPHALSDMLPVTRLEGSETVLVVEDQDEVRKLALAVLESFGYRTLEASSGGEALLVAESHRGPIHLLLTDVVMPHVTGKQLADRLTVVRPEMKVLYMSGYTAEVISRQGVPDSGIEYIPKPFTPEALALTVQRVLGKPRAAGKVLVVDDEESIRKLFAEILSGGGYEVDVAADGGQAQKILEAGSYDLVITDLVMPNREGIETIRAIRQSYPGVKIIAVSGAFVGSFLKTAAMLGADATLMKPVSPDQLIEAVRKTLGTR